jgi:hypothetical protein
MSNNRTYFIAVLIVLVSFLSLAVTEKVAAASDSASAIVNYPAPEGMPHNDDFSVKVRVPGGQWQELFEYDVQVDMHKPRHASMVYFDFSGTVEVSVTKNEGTVTSARIRPLSYGIKPKIDDNTIMFTLHKPLKVLVEFNDDIFGNLHVFGNPLEVNPPDPNDPNVIYFGPGIHTPVGKVVKIPSGRTVYIKGGAIVRAKLLCDRVENVRIVGRGILDHTERGVEVTYSKNVEIDGIIVMNPTHYTVYGGQSEDLTVRNIKSFSSRGWSDGIDVMSCSDMVIDDVFMRNSDDCIAIYTHRWNFYGDSKNVTVKNSTLWADVAHPIMIGTHGNPEKPETIEDISFYNIDILNHDEPQLNYQGCMSINVSDENLARNIRFEKIRVEDFEQGQLLNLRVTFNKKYAKAPGRGIENVYFKDITYNGNDANILSVIAGYNETRNIKNVIFENLSINGNLISEDMDKPSYYQLSDMAGFYLGPHVEGLEFRVSESDNAAIR